MNYTLSRTVSCEMIDMGKYWLHRRQEFRLEMKRIMIVIYNKRKRHQAKCCRYQSQREEHHGFTEPILACFLKLMRVRKQPGWHKMCLRYLWHKLYAGMAKQEDKNSCVGP